VGPLAPAQDYINHRLLGPERLLDELPRDSWVLPDWAADDPLDDLFRVWFGAYGTSAQGVSLEKQFAAPAMQARIDDGAEVPADAASWITPITATSGGIDLQRHVPWHRVRGRRPVGPGEPYGAVERPRVRCPRLPVPRRP